MTTPAAVTVPPLAGYTVGVTAARRADELCALLERRGAQVIHAPAIRIVPLADDARLLAATRTVLDRPVDAVVATTGIGFRGWVEAAEGWGLGSALVHRLGAATVYARGPKARGAVRAAGLVESWSPESEASAELRAHLLRSGVTGRRIAVQLHGEPLTSFVDALRAAGADVVPVPVYRWMGPTDPAPLHRLLDAVLAGAVDALTFTSAPAAASVLAAAEEGSRLDALVHALRTTVAAACVGDISASPLTGHGVPVLRPDRARIGALVRTLGAEMVDRAQTVVVGRSVLRVRGQAVVVDDELRPVPPAPMAVLRALSARPGRVVSRQALLAALPGNGEEHAVETAVARLRSALGDPGMVRTVVKRGYRLAADPVATTAR
ncbi:MAG TPA: uroporphyrinogen-III synthase [Pseudonocardiaceae bacterium]|nr:uroporphyrinogen-III synthase [Pseudonocardiaceae bacterium]